MMRPCSRKSKLKLSDRRCKFKEDMISALPDDVIVGILSLLTISEAARTSVLSRRWEKLWTLYNGSLIFDFKFTKFPFHISSMENDFGKLQRERTYFINLVNQVLFSLAGSNTVDLTLRCNFDEASKCHIDRWIEFALDRRIQRLELAVKPIAYSSSANRYIPYTFPLQFWTRVKQPRGGLHSISALTSLILKDIDISGEQVEYFLSNCPLLEHLFVQCSKQLSNLRVTGTKLQLKNLELIVCYNLGNLEISAPNLLSFSLCGSHVKLRIENAAQLVKLSTGPRDLTYLVGSFSSYFSQLETLQLKLMCEAHTKILQNLELIKLKHLILIVWPSGYEEIVYRWTTSLIKASPLLNKLTFEVKKEDGKDWRTYRKSWRKRQKVVEHEYTHKRLKVVEMIGFTGSPTGVEVLMSIANSNALEKIIIDCRLPVLIGTKFDGIFMSKRAKECAKYLKIILPRGLEVIIV